MVIVRSLVSIGPWELSVIEGCPFHIGGDCMKFCIFIGLRERSVIVGDFGRSRILDPAYSHNGYLTHGISTLWYKSPELLLNSSIYDSSVDIWAAGCVFAEMLLGKPLFEGQHEIDQLELILDSVCLTEEEWLKLRPQIPEKTAMAKTENQGSPLGSKFSYVDIQGKGGFVVG